LSIVKQACISNVLGIHEASNHIQPGKFRECRVRRCHTPLDSEAAMDGGPLDQIPSFSIVRTELIPELIFKVRFL
jgi:hypothetical protein